MTPRHDQPQITVLMAVHNGFRFLPEAAGSILRQTIADFEFLIINDGSTDGTADWLETQRDPRIRVVHQHKQGLAKSLNRGLALARGEFIARMDADDIARPNRLQRQLQEFQSDPDLVLLGSEVELTDADGRGLGTRNHATDHPEIRRRLLLGDGGALTHPAVMFRAAVIEQSGPYDERFVTTQDLDLFLRISEVGQVRNLPDTLLQWRQHPASVNHTQSETWTAMKRMAIESTIHRIGPEQFAAELFPVAQVASTAQKSSEPPSRPAPSGRFRSAWAALRRESQLSRHWSLTLCRQGCSFAKSLVRRIEGCR